ncbi:carboxypeptidase-like regulatory domain-containing protein [Hymenobacter ruricola]|uniref:Carboxypeptidase-like regulatory domain-containing protein n=1 Tax=Hymenobacter ruricola TaxID=2791023 RepID=A0ABS0I555_9BACT|nr:carboxypeptidase-like regulatory domain-containing protein [Hymenobacter ruricola]MBF9222099.1 carboxypeptidase-like regulatory domain-containing protein [Hymenobacter ruricola]
MRLLLLLCSCLLPAFAFAQTTVSGRVLDAKSGVGLPGVTVLQTGTTNGVSTGATGYFTLTVAGQPDSVALTVSSVGYATVQRVVAPGGNLLFRLVLASDQFCDLPVYSRFGVRLISGLRYTPVGGSLTLTHPRILGSQLSTTASYRTDFSRNYVWGVSMGLPSIHRYRRTSFSESVSYAKSSIPSATISFESAGVLVGIHSRNDHRPAVYGGIGVGRLHTFSPDGFASSTGPIMLWGSATSCHSASMPLPKPRAGPMPGNGRVACTGTYPLA